MTRSLVCLCTLRLVMSSVSDISTCAIYAGNSVSARQVCNFRRHSLPSSESQARLYPLRSSHCSSARLGPRRPPKLCRSSICWCCRLGGAHVWVPRWAGTCASLLFSFLTLQETAVHRLSWHAWRRRCGRSHT
ncbi:hypothetical protein LXA43DRAFT_985914 [Ganoderma leucocontextum]|nr:hypothetical protein LXA43DRAFT_985914 [Ganoderma leucocontextum]